MHGGESRSCSTREPRVVSAVFPSSIKGSGEKSAVAAANKGDPSSSSSPMSTKQPPVSCSWGEFMDEVSPELPPLFPILSERKEEEEEDDEAIARLLEEDVEEDDDDAILPPMPSPLGSALCEESPPNKHETSIRRADQV